jgi:hypothetical protein
MRSRLSVVLSLSLLLVLAATGCETSTEMAVTGINPRTGHIAGDQTVEIQGKNFRPDISYGVYFGKAKAANVTIKSKESLIVTSPSGQPGAVDVTVRPDNGQGFLLKQAFTYEDMGGSVVEGIGKPSEQKNRGNLAF